MSQSVFQVGAGLADDNIYYLSGFGAPVGTSGDLTFDAPVGSYYSDATSGATYKKVANNGNAADWSAGASTSALADLQAEVDRLETATGQNADGSFSAYTGTNYLGAASSLKDADVRLDAAVKANADAIAAETSRATGAEGVLTTAIATEQTRATSAEAALAAALATEAADRQAADTANAAATAAVAADLVTETAARVAGDAANATAIANEVTRATAAEGVLSAAIAQEVTDRTAAVAAEAALRVAGDAANATAVADEAAARIAADSAEAATRAAADTTLQANIDAEATARAAAVTAEATARAAADTALQTALDAEIARATAAEVAEAAARAAADTTLTTNLATEVTARTTADANLQSQIDALTGGGGGSIAALQAEIDAVELASGLNADGTFSAHTGTNYIDGATSVKGVDALLDAAIKARSDAAAAALTAAVSTLQAADTAEANTRSTNDTSLSTAIANEITRATGAEAAEATARANADAALQTEVDAVEAAVGLNTDGTFAGFAGSNYMGAATTVVAGVIALDAQVKTNTTNIATLTANFAGIDAALQAEIDRTQAAAGVAPDGQMVPFSGTNYLDAVSTIRAAIVTLDGQAKTNADAVVSEAGTRAAADTVLTTAIADEATARGAADLALQEELDRTQLGAGLGVDGTYVSPVLSSYLSTAGSLKAADSLLDAAIKAVSDRVDTLGGTDLANLTAALAAEVARATAAELAEQTARINADNAEATARADADTALQTAITAEAAARATADTTLTNNLAAEVTRATGVEATLAAADATETAARIAGDATNAAAVTAEAARATAAEAALQAAIDAEVSARTAADATLTTNLAAEVTRATAAEATLTSNLAAEITRAQNAEATLTTDLAAEVTRATAAEAAELARAQAAEATLTTNLASEVARATGVEAGLAAYVGKGAGALPTYSSTAIVATNDDLTVAIGKLDAAVKAVQEGTENVTLTPGVTTAAVVDSVKTHEVGLVKWLVYVQSGANKQAVEVLASHNGDTVVDATVAEYTTYAKLRMGNILGLQYTVTTSGVGAAQVMNLVVSSTATVTVRTVRDVITLA